MGLELAVEEMPKTDEIVKLWLALEELEKG